MYKSNRPKRILAIDPGTRYWGWAIFKGEYLYDCGVKTLKTRGSSKQRLKEARKVFSNLLEDYAPDVLILEKVFLFWAKQSKLLDVIIGEIKNLAKKEKVKVYEFSPRTVRKAICGNGNATKKDMAKILASRFPDLSIQLNQTKKYQKLYWGHMFDSVGLAVSWIEKEGV